MPYNFTVSDIIPADPQAIYDAWLDSEGHANLTGGASADISATEGANYAAWDGYISGKNIRLEAGKRIVQTWRTTEFRDTDPDSQIEVLLEPVSGGTQVTIHHTNVPDGQTGYEKGGWQESYFDTMKAFFGD
jgi:activator of HSP90 ATPase